VGTLAVMQVVQTTRIKEDAALGIILSVFFGFGLVLLTYIQKRPDAGQAGLDRFLFGQAATLLRRDVVLIAVLGSAAIGAMLLFWKEFKLLAFDRDFGGSLGFSMRTVDLVLTTVLVVAIVIGLQTVGVVLMSAMVVAPAAAARQWTDRLGTMVAVAGGFGALAGVSGAVASSLAERVPTGPSIVLALTVLVIVSITLAPNRGVVWAWARDRRSRRALRTGAVLADLRALAGQHDSLEHGHSPRVLEAMRGTGVARTLEALAARGWARRTGSDEWALTPAGLAEAERRAQQADADTDAYEEREP
jgi:manganese/zinc/iron transport system permease protein